MCNSTKSSTEAHTADCLDSGIKKFLKELGVKTKYCSIRAGVGSLLDEFHLSCDAKIADYEKQITRERRWKYWFVILTFAGLLTFPILLWAIDPVLKLLVGSRVVSEGVWSSSSVAAAALSGLLALHKSFSAWYRTRYREGGLWEAKAKLEEQRLTIKSNWFERAEQQVEGSINSEAKLRLKRAEANAVTVLSSLKKAISDREDAQISNSEENMIDAKARIEAATPRILTTSNAVLDAELAINDEEKPTTRFGKEIAFGDPFDPAFLQAIMAATLECRKIAREETVAHFAQMKLPDVDLAKNLTTAHTSAQNLLTAFKAQATPDAQKSADIAFKRAVLTSADQNLKMLANECDRIRELVAALEAASLDSSSAKADLQKSEALRVKAYQDLLKARSTLLLAGGSL